MIDEPVHGSEAAQARGDRMRLRDVDREPAGVAAELGGDVVRTRLVAAADRHTRAARDVGLGERTAEPRRTSDDDDVACHVVRASNPIA